MKAIFLAVALAVILCPSDGSGYRQCGFCHKKCSPNYNKKLIPCTSHCFSVAFKDGDVYRGCAPTNNAELPQKCYKWRTTHGGIKECYTCDRDSCNITPL
ncbi:uncharacterized protein LOC123012748 [Tribolium madens]|uniref:uncharacterized protein LOC123012748 n=1 Tax=Tribolium madens TaxID=41895 RepID=UPI001CF73C69|nr:uncharacterized protein LOC123012748 [Tribolium madens]